MIGHRALYKIGSWLVGYLAKSVVMAEEKHPHRHPQPTIFRYARQSAGTYGGTDHLSVLQVILHVTRCQIRKEWLALMQLRPQFVHLDDRMLRTVTDMIAVA